MTLDTQVGRLAFYRVVATVFGKEQTWRVAAEEFYSAQTLVKQKYSIFKRPFLSLEWYHDTDPVELSESGYLQKLAHMHIVQDLDQILESERA